MKNYNKINKQFQNDIAKAIKESLKSAKAEKQFVEVMPDNIKQHYKNVKDKVEAKSVAISASNKLSNQKLKQKLTKEIQEIFEEASQIDTEQQEKYFGINVVDHEFDDIQ